MRSPLAPRMMTVSASIPSYWFVWYIHTPHASARESLVEPMVLACPGLRCIRQPGDTQDLYCHKPAQESKPDLFPYLWGAERCVRRPGRCASYQAAGALQECGWGAHLGTQRKGCGGPVSRQVANDEGG